MLSRHFAAATAAFCLSLSTSVSNQSTEDWPQWRGPNRDGRSTETGLLTEWPADGPPLAWKAGGAGTGYSSMSTAAGRLFTVGSRGGTEYVHAFDVATGKKLWEAANGSEYSNDRGNGPRSTPTIDGNRLYVLGASGDLTCLDARRPASACGASTCSATFGGSNPKWGLSESPLVVSAIACWSTPAVRAPPMVALDKQSGKVIWKSESDGAGYSSAVVQRVGDTEQAVFFTADPRGGRRRQGRPPAVGLPARRQPRRQHRDAGREGQLRVPLIGLRHRRGAAEAGRRPAAASPPPRCTSRRRCAITTAARSWWAITSTDSRARFSRRCALPTASTAWKDRSVGKGLAGLRRRPPLSVQRKRRRRSRRSHADRLSSRRAASRSSRQGCRPGRIRSSPAAGCTSATRTRSTRTTCRKR